jgi:hypothetical protein
VAEVVVLPGLAVGGSTGRDRLAVEEDLDSADVAGEVSGLGAGLAERVRGDLLSLAECWVVAGFWCPSQACSSNRVIRGSLAL